MDIIKNAEVQESHSFIEQNYKYKNSLYMPKNNKLNDLSLDDFYAHSLAYSKQFYGRNAQVDTKIANNKIIYDKANTSKRKKREKQDQNQILFDRLKKHCESHSFFEKLKEYYGEPIKYNFKFRDLKHSLNKKANKNKDDKYKDWVFNKDINTKRVVLCNEERNTNIGEVIDYYHITETNQY